MAGVEDVEDEVELEEGEEGVAPALLVVEVVLTATSSPLPLALPEEKEGESDDEVAAVALPPVGRDAGAAPPPTEEGSAAFCFSASPWKCSAMTLL